MSWSDEDDLFDDGKSKKMHRKPRKHFERQDSDSENDDNDAEYRAENSGNAFFIAAAYEHYGDNRYDNGNNKLKYARNQSDRI